MNEDIPSELESWNDSMVIVSSKKNLIMTDFKGHISSKETSFEGISVMLCTFNVSYNSNVRRFVGRFFGAMRHISIISNWRFS